MCWIGDSMKQSYEALEDLMKICFGALELWLG